MEGYRRADLVEEAEEIALISMLFCSQFCLIFPFWA